MKWDMKDVGFWKVPKRGGYWSGDNLPDPTTLVDPEWEKDNRDKIIAYLKAGKPICAYMGYSHCRFNCGIPDPNMGDSDYSDGTYVWPQGLAHYIEKHNVKLPDDFVSHMKVKNWQVE